MITQHDNLTFTELTYIGGPALPIVIALFICPLFQCFLIVQVKHCLKSKMNFEKFPSMLTMLPQVMVLLLNSSCS